MPLPRTALLALLTVAAALGPAADGAAQEAGDPAPGTPVALVTGSTGGLGREVARLLAAEGVHVVVHGRSEERGRALVEEIEADGGSADFVSADFASLAEVRGLADAVLREHDRLNVLVNNAGVWLGGERRESEDGHELHFQVNYLAGFLLTHELLPLLREADGARIVNVASVAQAPIDFDDPMLEDGYGGGRAYGQSKLAQIMFTFDLAEELDGTGVVVSALHPGTLMDTDMVLERGITPRASVHDGAAAVMRLITSDAVESGSYHEVTEPARAHEQAYDEEARARLRALAEKLTGAGGEAS